MTRVRAFSWGVAVAGLVVLLVVSGGPGAAAVPLGGPRAGGLASGAASVGSATAARSNGGAPAAADIAASSPGPSCAMRAANLSKLFGAWPAPAVLGADPGSCAPGPDQAILDLLSGSAGSGSRVRFSIDLPAAGTDPGSALSDFWVGMALSGVPCAYDGASYLEVELAPPYDDLGRSAGGNWSVVTPVFSLVPTASCDPGCENDTAFLTIGGIAYCEDDVLTDAPGSLGAPAWGGFAPGDALTVDLVGLPNGTDGLGIYVNDTTHPAADVGIRLDANATVTGRALAPLHATSTLLGASWTPAADVAVGWTDCPGSGAAGGASRCNSYDGAAVAAVGVPALTGVHYWDGSSLTYVDGYTSLATISSSGGCSGDAVPCGDFTSFGGSGSYPAWSLHAAGGTAWWAAGGSPATVADAFGGAAAEYAPNGSWAVPHPTTGIASVASALVGPILDVNVTAADPNGVAAVDVEGLFCFGGSSTATTSTVTAVLNATAGSTAYDGRWTAAFSVGTHGGTMGYSVRAESATGAWTAPKLGSTVLNGTGSCTIPALAAPAFTAANVSTVGGGYALNWTESSAGIADYTVYLNASGNATEVAFDVGTATAATVRPGVGGVAYAVRVTATDLAGQNATVGPVGAPPTLEPLRATVTPASTDFLWAGNATAYGNVSVAGGSGPYTVTIAFGDGTFTTHVSDNTTVPFVHVYSTYLGTARLIASATDPLGDAASSAVRLVSVAGTPLGVPQAIASGDGLVNVTFVLPRSPGGPVTGYTVFSTDDPAAAEVLTATWPHNDTAAGTSVWNTTDPWLKVFVPDGVPLFVQVVAWNAFGAGTLSNGSTSLSAVPAPLVLGPIEGDPGGPAPFTDSLSAFVSTGTNDPITSALYTTGSTQVAAAVEPAPGGYYLNASVLLATAGSHVIVLHVADAFSDIGLEVTTVLVTPGAGPVLVLTPPNPNGWFGYVGSPVAMSVTPSGGSGPYTANWAFGDGTDAGGLNVTHAWTAPGNFTILLTATDAGTSGISTWLQPITIYAPPTIVVASSPSTSGRAYTWTFTGSVTGGSGPAKVTWAFGDGTTGNSTGAAPSITHEFPGPGTYTVNATALDPQGRSGSAEVTVAVGGPASGSGGGAYLGLAASVWGPIAIGLGVAAVLLAAAAVALLRKSPPVPDDDEPRDPPRPLPGPKMPAEPEEE